MEERTVGHSSTRVRHDNVGGPTRDIAISSFIYLLQSTEHQGLSLLNFMNKLAK